jgi:hypothetical protein
MTRSRRALAALVGMLLVPGSLHASAKSPRPVQVVASLEVSTEAGLGRIEIHADVAAILQRDEGIVSLVDISNPARPKVLGRFDDDARQSLDGDLAFSSDGRWIFYARQTVQFSRDGIHVLDVSDPAAPSLASYQPAGGTLRVDYFDDGTNEWVVTMDAIAGLVVYRFEATTGVLIPVHVSPLPELKVGGPASAGIEIMRDPILEIPLMYASTGKTGVEVFDFSDPTNPELLGAWGDLGLAEIEVKVSGKKRTIYGASEYWFDAQQEPVVVELDASNLSKIKRVRVLTTRSVPDDRFRVQGMALSGGTLFAAHSELGLVMFTPKLDVGLSLANFDDERNGAAGVLGQANYTFDVEFRKGLAYVTDAATGTLTIIRSAWF